MLGLQAQSLYTLHQGQSGGRGLSPRLWGNAIGQSLTPDGFGNAYGHFDDFVNFGAVGTGTLVGYGAFATAACTIAQTTARGGVVRFTTDATDNSECALMGGGATGAPWGINTASGQDQVLIFETRFRTSSVTATNRQFFLGLAEENLAVNDGFFSDANAIADKDFIGFYSLTASPATLRFSYQKAGTAGDYTDHDFIVSSSLAANTWYKVGFIYDPKATPSEAIRVYLDNEVCSTTIPRSDIVDSSGTAVAVFPNGEALTSLLTLKNDGAAAMTMDIDWLAIFQNGPTS